MGKFQTIVVILVVLTVIVGSIIQVVPVYRKLEMKKREVAAKEARLERVRAELHSLQQEVHDLEHNPSATEKVAREKFNYCREGEKIYLYTE